MRKVYVVEEPLKRMPNGQVKQRVDLRPAAEFGELVFLLNWGDSASLDADELVEKLRDGLKDYQEDDYLLMIGSPTAMWLAGAIAAEATNGKVTALEWDREDREYYCFTVDLGVPYDHA